MLYVNEIKGDFPKLAKALKQYGITDGVVKIAVEYLSTEHERDDSLLERIPLHSSVRDYNKWEELRKAIKREILTDRTGELKNRYILLAHALYGSDCVYAVGALYGSYYLDEKMFKEMTKALALRFGEKAEACFYAIMINAVIGTTVAYNLRENKSASPEVCVDAVEFADRNPVLVSILCAKALNQTPTPERHGILGSWFRSAKEQTETTAKALGYIHDLIDKNSKPYTELVMASGEGAYFSEKCRKFFENNMTYNLKVLNAVSNHMADWVRFLDLAVETPYAIDPSFVICVAKNYKGKAVERFLGQVAEKYTDLYLKAIDITDETAVVKKMEEILISVKPEYAEKADKNREKAQRRASETISQIFEGSDRADIRKYLHGYIPSDDIMPVARRGVNGSVYGIQTDYITAYGIDDFSKRLITLLSVTVIDSYLNMRYFIDFNINFETELFTDILAEQIKDGDIFLGSIAMQIEKEYNSVHTLEKAYDAVAKYAEKIADCNVKDLSVNARCIYVMALGKADSEKYKDKIFALTGDTSKKVKEALASVISPHIDWKEDILNLLTAKKVGMREIATEVIKRQGAENYREELGKAFETEKSDKIKTKIAEIMNMEYTASEKSAEKLGTGSDIVASIAKGAKLKKVAWLFENPYRAVHFEDGTEVPENHLKALVILYSDMQSAGINQTAVSIAEKINKDELGNFVLDVFSRWLEKGAVAKTKWVLWFCGVHGNSSMIKNFMHYIKEWSEHQRSAIAGEAVYALAMNGSSEALMNVDSMARKFKNKQVRNSANQALLSVAEQLGITKEELADRIVPDMNFDENMCRVFDYGKRQFSVYLTPSLELEIYNGDKKVKTMPKPSASDDKEIAEKSYNDFKEMKKQIKTVISSQKARLEYVLMCDRKWTADNWRKLFVKNPVMHCFAIGLIWGIYDENGLSDSFRYMDDGSFTDIEGDEFEIPENAEIGLVHPVELTDGQRLAWAEQLADYEITQPFQQIGRPFYKPTDSELNDDEITRFDGAEVNNFSLVGRIQKLGWDKGEAQDAGFFYEFVRRDFTKCSRDTDGSILYSGMVTELEFSGMDISMYYMETENATLKVVKFYSLGSRKALKIKNVNPRYFSEIILQISSFASKPEE